MPNHADIKSIVNNSKNICCISGSGISTDSGILDFRSKQGLYSTTPEEIMSRNFFFKKPKQFYDFLEKNLYHPQALPNKGHNIISKLEDEGRILQVITQNIDGLHSAAGNTKVIEFHGTIKTATCCNPKCKKVYPIDEILNKKKISDDFYMCDCGKSSTKRYIKPDIVLFGEQGYWMSRKRFVNLLKESRQADLLLVLGTSLLVYPFNRIVSDRKPNTPVIIINQGTTPFDNEPNVYVINQRIAETLLELFPTL
ncbi:Sir2 family NAD-dependent protein deacetylase [Bacillus bombysepticus]|uniref:Sir2 family NAD-dependent protein deacetylase n=1 Tax=Bacillus bombysepticus TaxID=658666 RepID=UPI003018F2CC